MGFVQLVVAALIAWAVGMAGLIGLGVALSRATLWAATGPDMRCADRRGSRRGRSALAAALGLAACADRAAPPPACDAGPVQVGLFSALRFSTQVAPMTSAGFDLDGEATAAGDDGGCGIADDTSPDGAPGVDNAFARLLPALAATPLGAVDDLLADMIAEGELLLLPRLRGLDDPQDDPCVALDIVRGDRAPMRGHDGAVLPWQTFPARASVEPADVGEVAVDGGVVEGEGFELAFDVAYLGVSVRFRLLDARLRMTLGPDGTFSGLVGGGVAVDDVLDLSGVPNLDPAVLQIVGGLLSQVADLRGDDGACSRVSTTFVFEGVPAFLYGGEG